MSTETILSDAQRELLESWRAAGQRVVFTNGVFDLLHRGHVEYLAEARSLGDRLVIGINSDASARGLGKGPGRPLVAEADRAAVVASLACADLVVIFDEPTPERLIREVRPAVLAKGSDWETQRIAGREFVESLGGQVVRIPVREGLSTSALVARLKASVEAERAVTRTDRELLRHAIAVIAYRGAKPLRGAAAAFAGHDTGGGTTPIKILSHVSDLIDWALQLARGEKGWASVPIGDWEVEGARFHASLARLDAYLASEAPLDAETTRLLQGPIADALTHVGQLMMLRRMTGSPVYGENYFLADIVTGRVGPEQSPPVKPF